MKRKRKSSSTLFFWDGGVSNSKRSKEDEDPIPDDLKFRPEKPQIGLLHTKAISVKNSLPLPYELLVKIFENLVNISDHPLRDLCSLARVCEVWRRIIITTPSLWSRINLASVPMTDGNVKTLKKVFEISEPTIRYVKELSFSGALECKNNESFTFLEKLITAPRLTKLSLNNIKSQNRLSFSTLITRTINSCAKLKELSIVQSRELFSNQKWLTDYLTRNGKQVEILSLSMSMNSISPTLLRAVGSEFCPRLKVLDLSTCDALNTRSFDAIQFSQDMPHLEVLRVGNVSFKRVHNPPDSFGLVELRELSMPIARRDADRDDALFATLTFGSNRVHTLDLRGSSITSQALLDMPSFGVRELHMDDLCPITRQSYHKVIKKWSKTLEVLSLVKINCSLTIKTCLEALTESADPVLIRELDLSSSDVTAPDLKKFLKAAKSLEHINLSSCRSLPRGFKGLYSKKPINLSTQELKSLTSKL